MGLGIRALLVFLSIQAAACGDDPVTPPVPGTALGEWTALVSGRFAADHALLGALAVLLLSGILDPAEALAGFGSPAVATIGVLYVVVAGVQETGGLQWISRHVLGQPASLRGAQLRLMAPVIALSAFLNNTPVVALLIPPVMDWGRRIRVRPSRLLIPLSYASILGGLCTIIGTSTNLVVSGMVQARYGGGGFSFFEIAKIGAPCAVVGVMLILALPRLLPDRRAFDEVMEDPREYTFEMQVPAGSPLAGKTIEEAGLRHLPGAFIAELARGDRVIAAVPPEEVLREGDRLVFAGNVQSAKSLYAERGLIPAADQIFKLSSPRHERCLVEAVVSNTCPLIGRSIRDGRFRDRYNAVVIAVARNGERIRGRIGDIVLRPGDTLLIESHAGFAARQRESRDFYLVSGIADSTPKRFDRAPLAAAILAGMVIAVAMGWTTMLKGSLAAAGLMLLSGCCSPGQARRNIEWSVLLTIAGALGLGLALETTGAAEAFANILLGIAGGHPWLSLAMVYLLTGLFTEMITNNAAAVLVFPIAMNAAEQLGVSSMPFVACVMVGASASFATPIGYQTNLMVYGPGGYRFIDYLRIGLPLSLAVGGTAILLAPLIWPFG